MADTRETQEGPSLDAVRHSVQGNRKAPEPAASVPHGIPGDGAEDRPRTPSGPQDPGLWTPANIVTCVRVVATFFWLVAAELVAVPDRAGFSVPVLALAVFFGLIAATDSLDGYLARSRNEVTDFGKFLDPIADKLVVVVALLVLMTWGLISIWVPVIVICREFLVSALRMVVASKGVVVAASNLGKWKTATTMGAIAGYFVAMALPQCFFSDALLTCAFLAMAVAVVLTVWSGIDYLVHCWHYIS